MFPVIIRGLIIGKPDTGYVLTVQYGEIGLLGNLAQLPVMIEEGRGDHNGEYSIRILGFNLSFLGRGGLQQLVHTRNGTEYGDLSGFEILHCDVFAHIYLSLTHTERHYIMKIGGEQALTFPK